MARRAALLGLLGLLAACENPVDDSVNVLPGALSGDSTGGKDTKTPGALDVPADVSPVECSDCMKVGDFYRVNLLEVTQLDGKDHPVIGVLNPLWKEDIHLFELNILFRVVAIEDTKLELAVISGARVGTDGKVCIVKDTEAPLKLTRAGCFAPDSEPAALNIYAGAPTTPKNCTVSPTTLPVRHVIPVVNAKITGQVATDCSTMTNGQVDGVIAEEALKQICTCSTGTGVFSDKCGSPDNSYADAKCGGCGNSWKSLMDLLKAFGALDYGCKTEDGKPGVCLLAHFEAERFPETPPPCP
ncbi:MAG: hypothetical protein AMXMBFR64_27400 [Myxococcales bacterium]